MIGPQDVGHRVVVRRVVGVRDGRPLFTDILGELIDYDESELTVAAKNGPVSVPIGAVVAAKRIPARVERPPGPTIDGPGAGASS
jgi:hypothetical protein